MAYYIFCCLGSFPEIKRALNASFFPPFWLFSIKTFKSHTPHTNCIERHVAMLTFRICMSLISVKCQTKSPLFEKHKLLFQPNVSSRSIQCSMGYESRRATKHSALPLLVAFLIGPWKIMWCSLMNHTKLFQADGGSIIVCCMGWVCLNTSSISGC